MLEETQVSELEPVAAFLSEKLLISCKRALWEVEDRKLRLSWTGRNGLWAAEPLFADLHSMESGLCF